MADCLLELERVRRAYPEFLLEASFSVRGGEFFSILGPSGSGKTTLLRLIAGFGRPQAGRILLAGREITALPPNKRRIGMVFQDYALFPHLSVGENIAYSLRMKRVPAAERRRKVEEFLDLTGLPGFAGRAPASLSGGEKQRVALARALAAEPLILLLDEPFSALDQALRKHLRREVRALQRRAGFTAIFVTHSQEEACLLSDRMLVMSQGCVEQVGAPAELYGEPANERVAAFLGDLNRLPAVMRGNGRELLLGGTLLPPPGRGRVWPDGRGWLCWRPETGRLLAEPAPGACLPVTVVDWEYGGPTVSITLRGDGWRATVLSLGGAPPPVPPGGGGWLAVDLERAWFTPDSEGPRIE